MKLSKNFDLNEFTRSATAIAKGIDNIPNAEQVENLRRLCVRLLEPLRDLLGEPLKINSGFRNQKLNQAVGGVSSSQHTKGQAADIRVEDPRELLRVLKQSSLDFDQAILYPTFLHLSYNSANNRKQVLYAKGVQA